MAFPNGPGVLLVEEGDKGNLRIKRRLSKSILS